MKPTLCSRCKKNLAVVFITKIDGGKTVNEGLCLKCAKEMGIKPVDDMIERMGLSEDDLENLNGEMTEAMNGLESLTARPPRSPSSTSSLVPPVRGRTTRLPSRSRKKPRAASAPVTSRTARTRSINSLTPTARI